MRSIGIVGNPNSGKTTLFNQLTGLRQKTGNYPGVTTEVFQGRIRLPELGPTRLLDLPGAYSLYPNTSDEFELVKLILSRDADTQLDLLLYVADANALDKQLLLLTQLMDLGLPCALILTKAEKITADQLAALVHALNSFFNIPIFIQPLPTDQKALMAWLATIINSAAPADRPHYQLSESEIDIVKSMTFNGETKNIYQQLLLFHHSDKINVPVSSMELSTNVLARRTQMQIDETMRRYESLQALEQSVQGILVKPKTSKTDTVDQIVTNPIIGPIIFLAALLFVFQAIYAWAELPMLFIDETFTALGVGLRDAMGESLLTDFLVDGVLAGLGGIIVFIPQIAILFFLLGLMEESGYMARAVFMFDHIMRRFGLSGKSLVALMSAGACAIPAVMSTRTIENNKERLITILVSPFVSCSARIPVYTILIGLAVPAVTVFGIFNLKGLVFTSLYIASVMAALLSGFILKFFWKRERSSQLFIELPNYRIPNLRNVFLMMWNKTKSFVIEAGKIILVISMILWFLGSFGPGKSMMLAEDKARVEAVNTDLSEDELQALVSAKRLEASYAGKLGKWMEPVIEPLGYDWKIGIALLASFAAREVFVGTIATIYSMEDHAEDQLLLERLASEVNPKNGEPRYNLATSISLIVFFLFAMQCMSTLAIVKRETASWKWPLLQFFGMTTLAYISAYLIYQVLS